MLYIKSPRDLWIAASLLVAGFASGWVAVVGVMELSGVDKVPRGTYVLRQDLERDYLAKDRLQGEYMERSEVQKSFIPRSEVERSFVETLTCQQRIDQARAACNDAPIIGNVDNPASSARPLSLGSVKEEDNLVLALQGCTASGSTISCDILLTNKEDDRKIKIFCASVAFDDKGNELRTEKVRIANSAESCVDTWYVDPSVSKELISGVATKAVLVFRQSTPKAQRLASLSIRGSGTRDFLVKFRDVEIQNTWPTQG